MVIRSKSDLLRYPLYIFDLDNTIYKEEDYLFQGYQAIARHLAQSSGTLSPEEIFEKLLDLYKINGRKKIFNLLISDIGFDQKCVRSCVDILHSFEVKEQLEIYSPVRTLLLELIELNKDIFVLTNGNIIQQRNKINSVKWGTLRGYIKFILADEIDPKPSPKGVEHILKVAVKRKDEALFIGDSEIDHICAQNAGIEYLDVNEIFNIN